MIACVYIHGYRCQQNILIMAQKEINFAINSVHALMQHSMAFKVYGLSYMHSLLIILYFRISVIGFDIRETGSKERQLINGFFSADEVTFNGCICHAIWRNWQIM